MAVVGCRGLPTSFWEILGHAVLYGQTFSHVKHCCSRVVIVVVNGIDVAECDGDVAAGETDGSHAVAMNRWQLREKRVTSVRDRKFKYRIRGQTEVKIYVFTMLAQPGQGCPSRKIGSRSLTRTDIRRLTPATGRSSVLGFFIGVLRGAGATIASFLSYAMEKRLAKDGFTFGKGNAKGVAAPEAANNAAAVGSFVPLMTLGIPGSATTAILLGALLVFGVQPGPLLLNERPEIFWGLVASMYIGNVVLLVLNLPAVPVFARLLRTPQAILLPLIVVFCVIGVYGLSFSTFDLWLLVAFGVVGLLLRVNGFPLPPLILGLILGGTAEVSMRQALQISAGDWSTFLTRPVSATLLSLAALSVLLPVLGAVRRRRHERSHRRGGDADRRTASRTV